MSEKKTVTKKEIIPIILMGFLFVLIQGLAILIIGPFQAAGMEPAFENPDNPINIIYIFAIILVFTVAILLIAKYWKKQLIQVIILGAIGYTTFYVLLYLSYLIFNSCYFFI